MKKKAPMPGLVCQSEAFHLDSGSLNREVFLIESKIIDFFNYLPLNMFIVVKAEAL